jgi:hypothetical protein
VQFRTADGWVDAEPDAERDAEPRVSFTVRGPTRIPAGELREAELT